MAKKRKRRKKNKKTADSSFIDEEENPPLARGEEIIDDDVFRLARSLHIRVNRTQFKEAGYICNTCQWPTKKVGVNGRNAMRAHLKKHVNERRARNHLLIYVWVGVMLVLGVLIFSADSRFDLGLSKILYQDLTWSDAAGPVLAGGSFLVASGFLGFEILYRKSPTKQRKTGYFVSVILTSAVLASEVVLAFDLAGIQINWFWFLSGFMPIASLAATRSEIAFTTLRRSRRQIRPQNYVRRYRAITEIGDDEVIELKHEIQKKFRNKELRLKKLKPWQKRALITLRILRWVE